MTSSMFDVDGRPFKKCANPLCDRKVREGVMYCCGPCSEANGKYEIHDSGLLGHTDTCDERHKERGSYVQ